MGHLGEAELAQIGQCRDVGEARHQKVQALTQRQLLEHNIDIIKPQKSPAVVLPLSP